MGTVAHQVFNYADRGLAIPEFGYTDFVPVAIQDGPYCRSDLTGLVPNDPQAERAAHVPGPGRGRELAKERLCVFRVPDVILARG